MKTALPASGSTLGRGDSRHELPKHKKADTPPELGFPTHYTGHLHDDLSLRALYNAANLLVIPSRQDNLPNTVVEAHACDTPVVAFNAGGLADIVEYQRTCYLAAPFDTEDLAEGIRWVLAAVGGYAITRGKGLWSDSRIPGWLSSFDVYTRMC